MKTLILILTLAALLPGLLPAQTPPSGAATSIDWRRAQELFQKNQRGEKLNPEDRAYLDQAIAARKRGVPRQGTGGPRGGGGGEQRQAPASLKPLTDMTAQDRYEGEDGGLYGSGSNQPPEPLQKAAQTALTQIQPLDATGKPAADGCIVFISISMSNATQEFSAFKRLADADPRKSPQVTIVDCAQGGQTMEAWAPMEGRPWPVAMERLQNAGVTPQQVQVAWIKLANGGPTGSFKDHLTKLEADTVQVLHNARTRFPNLRIAYLGSRIWGGNATTRLNPEPYAYEGAFAVRHLIQKQMQGDTALATAKTPLLLWGPYLWAQGEKGRQLDTLKWLKQDFTGDGVHPSDSGREKVANQLLDFFTQDALAKSWFTKR